MSLSDQRRRHRFHESRWTADIHVYVVADAETRHREITAADPPWRPGPLRRGHTGVDHGCRQPVTISLELRQFLCVEDVSRTAHRVDEPKLYSTVRCPMSQ